MAVSTISPISKVMSSTWVFVPDGFGDIKGFPRKDTTNEHVKRSTTLFPMRINEDSSTSRSEIVDTHDQSLCTSNSDIANLSALRCNVARESLTKGSMLPNTPNIKQPGIETLKERFSPQKNRESVDSTISASEQLKESPNKRKLSLGRIPKYVKCFLCEGLIKEDHFSEHLLFGSVKCSTCNIRFTNCQSFQVWTTEYALGNVYCNHDFTYTGDPAMYLITKLSQSQSENLLEKILSTKLLENYINKLKSLEDRSPWQHAIRVCKDFLSFNPATCLELNERENNGRNEDVFGIGKRNVLNSAITENDWTNDRINVSSPIEEECSGGILSQDYNLEQLEEATEFVKVPENCFYTTESQSQKTTGKKQRTKKLKNKNATLMSEGDEPLEFVKIPINGFYYVSTKPVEECPNCYEKLCPSQFTVNVLTFLMTTICVECNLTVYITSPDVHIVTGDEHEPKGHMMNENQKANNLIAKKPKKPRGRPRKSKALPFFKK